MSVHQFVSPVSGSRIVSGLHHLIRILNEYIRVEKGISSKKECLEVGSIVSVLSLYIIIYVYVHRFSSSFFSLSLHLQLVGPQFPTRG